jgi:hypothetical protein
MLLDHSAILAGCLNHVETADRFHVIYDHFETSTYPDDILFRIERIVEDDLIPSLTDETADAFFVYQKIEDIWAHLDPTHPVTKPDWEVFVPPTSIALDSLLDAIASNDVELVEVLARDLARDAGLKI